MTVDREQARLDGIPLERLREMERLFGSKHECSASVNKAGRELLRAYQLCLAELEQAEKRVERVYESAHGWEGADQSAALDYWKSRAEGAERLAEQAERERDERTVQREYWCERAVTAEAQLAKVPALVEAVASALTSLGTGPLKDGYAYAVLAEALAAWEKA